MSFDGHDRRRLGCMGLGPLGLASFCFCWKKIDFYNYLVDVRGAMRCDFEPFLALHFAVRFN